MNRSGPKERILTTAKNLFYRHGYETTGVNQLLTDSGSHKQSFYQYFPSKSDLGKAYLEEQRQELIRLVTYLYRKKETPADWIEAWAKLLKRQAASKDFFGCPFANFSAQTIHIKNDFQKELKETISDLLSAFEIFFEGWKTNGHLTTNISSTKLAKKTLMIYEGNIQLYLITNEKEYLNALEEDFLDLIGG
ncbi:TetR/AcrR family transcriptional regulator [Leptospira idonii]|uniref:TetR/AcrR family transcriptional regulator n=1 Tax=Leptospira idonii TaxID=1193500 RepID=A0A4R9LW30_9LEPT|nr:TetR/AcrR family transcriptional regulator [Leptospira idonii]TGN17273.1 TetR/AcrR family transcriptional regulator [Leptospira idonii]